MNKKVWAFIFARGGSKGVPRKNLRRLGDRPLIAHSIQVALATPQIERVIVSTDDEEIAEISVQYGAEVPFMRPAQLAADDSPEWLAWQHAIRSVSADSAPPFDVFVSLPPTSPMRLPCDVTACIDEFVSASPDMVISVSPAARNPYFNMVMLDQSGNARLVMNPERKITRRQMAPAVYDITTVAYCANPEFILRATSVFDGSVRAVVIPAERSLDIDTETDFAFAEYLVTRRPVASRSNSQ